MVELTGLGSLCLSKSVEPCLSILGVCPVVELTGLGLVISEKFRSERRRVLSVHIGVCPVVEQTGLGLLCLSERGGVPRMCVGSVKRVVISEKFR